MADFNSKYTGEQVDALLDIVSQGGVGGGGGIVVETDPIFSASPAASITEEKKTEWDGKQDTIVDLATIREGASKGATALQSVPSEYVTEDEVIWTKAEGETGVRLKGTNGTATGNLAISAGDDKTASDGTVFTSAASGDHAVAFGFGNTCSGRTTLAQGLYNIVSGKDSVAFGQRNTVNGDQAFAAGQQNEVTTRLGVTLGYQNKATNTNSIAIGYKNTSSGSGSVALGDTCESGGTSSTAMGYNTKATGAYSATFGENTQATNNGEVAMGSYNKSTTSTDPSEQTAFSFGIGTSDTNRQNAVEIKKNGDVYIGDKSLAKVATSGSYNDLSNKPTIATKVSELTNDAGFIDSDAADERYIQADTAGESVYADVNGLADSQMAYALPTSANGDEDDILLSRSFVKTINGESVYGSGDIEVAPQSAFDSLVDTVTNLDADVAQLTKDVPNKQEALVSGTNIKTINGESILGSGDITIEGGNGSTNGIAMKVEYITPTDSSIAFIGTEQRPSMKANTIYVQQAGSSYAETLDGLDIESFEETTEAYAEYVIIFVFNSPLFGATISLPSYVKWTNGTPPAVEAEVVYELNISRSILAGEATYCAVLTPFKHAE